MTQQRSKTNVELLSRVAELEEENATLRHEVERYRAHSVLLNTVSWKLYSALGLIPGDATVYVGDIEGDIDLICDLVRSARAAASDGAQP